MRFPSPTDGLWMISKGWWGCPCSSVLPRLCFTPALHTGEVQMKAFGCFAAGLLTVFSVFSNTSRASSKLHFSSMHSLSRFPGINSSSLFELPRLVLLRTVFASLFSIKTAIGRESQAAEWPWGWQQGSALPQNPSREFIIPHCPTASDVSGALLPTLGFFGV